MNKEQLLQDAARLAPELIRHRRFLHSHAEVGFDLENTLAYVAGALKDMGYAPVKYGKAGLAVTVGNGEGKSFLLRADMDALPVTEEADVDFACKNGNMHACGHDIHTAMLLGAAKLLKDRESELKGTVRLMFQPAEETFEGAADMIGAGVLEGVEGAMMIHVAAGMPIPAGTVIVSSPGVSAPAADYFTVKVQGKGCHGSAPQNGIDALTAAAHILIGLQEIQARELAASQEAVLTVGTFHGGDAANVIADTATMSGTIRTYDEETRAYLKTRICDIAKGIATAFRAEAEVSFGTGCPTLINDKGMSQAVWEAASELLGPNRAFTTAQLNGGQPARGGGSEDFAYVSQQVPAVMVALAAGEPAKGYPYPQHHPKVKFDESVLPLGSAFLAWCAMKHFKSFPGVFGERRLKYGKSNTGDGV